MAEATLTIHLHEATERDKRGLAVLEKIVDKNYPIALAFGVDNIEAWRKDQPFYNHMKYLITAPNVSVVQRGYRNRCPHPHKIRDPHHENACPTMLPRNIGKGMKGLGEGMAALGGMSSQADVAGRFEGRVAQVVDRVTDIAKRVMDITNPVVFMLVGKQKITETLEKEPVAYCPPNNLYDRMTVQIARDLGYKHFTIPSALPAWPYKIRDICMVIIPQTSLERYGIGRHAYAHLDHLPELEKNGKLERHLDQKLVPITDIKKEPWLVKQAINRALLVPVNDLLHYSYTHLRDAKRAVNYFLKKK